MSPFEIREDDLTGEAITHLLRRHLEHMHEITPAGSAHALDLAELRRSDVTFWSVWEGGALLGCGALKQLDVSSAEIKSMRTAEAFRGRGVASRLLEFILEEAVRRGYEHVHLETGALPEFEPARRLYLRHGFTFRDAFANYVEDANSVFMTRRVRAAAP